MEDNEEINVDFSKIWSILKKEKWLIIATTLIFGIIGLLYSFTLQEEFISEGKILPEMQSKSGGMGQFAGLAALAGVDFAGTTGGTDAVRPDLYPDVLKTTPFFLEILKTNFKGKYSKSKTLEKALLSFGKYEENTINTKLNYPINNSEYITYSKQTGNLIKEMKARLNCVYDKKTGVISISAKMPDPVLAAEVANFSMRYLTNYIINYRTEKQKNDLNFIAERLAAAKGKYYYNQERKASYSDQLPLAALRMQSADLARERIESDYKITSNFYNTLLQKYEEAKMKMQQETPVIKVLEPAVVPNLKSEPRKIIIVIAATVFGFVISLILVFLYNGNYKAILN